MRYTIALTAGLALAACSGGDSTNTQSAEQATETAQEQTSTVEQAQEIANQVAEKAAAVAEALKLDTSSLDSFKSSLSDMQASLSTDQAGQLTDALGYLAKSSAKESKGGLLSAAKDVVGGKSMEDILYDNMKDKLDGLTFEEIVGLAG
ncbi:MAG: hypothetical protein JJ850_15040 [Kordiimonadaceae bacterium]|nr:hypothetical protein [Kordiimonadaceae bacterium]MBO6569967.1 hypothetical protein [Kordiimonadaceae bacterium]MBO6965936.1 hypothetical protein [Kordiimonadaceae bacterium]